MPDLTPTGPDPDPGGVGRTPPVENPVSCLDLYSIEKIWKPFAFFDFILFSLVY
jgi:hypothetical protein